MSIPMQTRIELADMPRDPMNILSSVRAPLVKLRNSARLNESKRKLLKETLEFVLSTLEDAPVDAPEDKGAEKAPEEPVSTPEHSPATKAQPKSKKRATAKVDPASV